MLQSLRSGSIFAYYSQSISLLQVEVQGFGSTREGERRSRLDEYCSPVCVLSITPGQESQWLYLPGLVACSWVGIYKWDGRHGIRKKRRQSRADLEQILLQPWPLQESDPVLIPCTSHSKDSQRHAQHSMSAQTGIYPHKHTAANILQQV